MYSMLRNKRLRKQLASEARSVVVTQAFALFPALVVTELFYHWKSFLLELGGFLATWLVIDFVVTTVRDALTARRGTRSRSV